MFVDRTVIPVVLGEDMIGIKPKMDFGTRNACQDALIAIAPDDAGKAEKALHVGAYQVALMVHNIVSWSGPAFVGVPCTPENIARLDPDEPLVEKVLAEIVARNPLQKKEATAAKKKGSTNAGGPPSAA